MKSILLALLVPFLLGAQVTAPGLTTVAPEVIARLDTRPALVYARYGQSMAMGAQSDLQSDRIRALSRRPQDPFYRPFLGGGVSVEVKL